MSSAHRLALTVLLLGSAGCTPGLVDAVPPSVVDAFLTPDQQGRFWLEAGDPGRAARSFEDRLWKGLAYYAAEDWSSAAAALARVDTARGQLHYGNALARQERLPEAIEAYRHALTLRADFPEARFNLDWVEGLLELDQKEYEDAGGTGGKLEADEIVFDEKGARGKGEMTREEARAQGLSDAQLREMWMRRVQTTPADFLRLKFSYQAQSEGSAGEGPP